jgi:MFS family permease
VLAARRGISLNEAVVSGGLLVTVAYSILGRGVGVPLAGQLCDILRRRGVSRTTVTLLWLVLAIVLLQILAFGGIGVAMLAALAFLLGVSVNLFPLMTAAISETYGPERTGSIVAFVNMMGQLSGASMLAVSGYVGLALSTTPGNSLAEYRGIWLSAMVTVAVLTALGVITQLALQRSALSDGRSGGGA